MRGRDTSLRAVKIEFDQRNLWMILSDGRRLANSSERYPRLENGSAEARLDYFISPGGVHWEQLDEDISVDGFLAVARQAGESHSPSRAA